ncbi:major facilitator superfamily domain-containing protein, partial [Bombardia bombarda]
MEPTGEPAPPFGRGVVYTAKQSWKDLFIFKQRVEITNEFGETTTEWAKPVPLRNPITLVAQLSIKDWLFFTVGFTAWAADAFDFHSLAIQQVKLAAYYGKTKTEISTAITLTLLLRSVGAAMFGFAGDKWGRKWPMVFNMIVLGLLQIGTIYAVTFEQFLAVRAIFGLFMGGVYGNAIAMALENSPSDARGILSGLLQQGYCAGYVGAAAGNLGVGAAVESWKLVFWISAGISIAVGLVRSVMPESRQFIEARAAKKAHTGQINSFWKETKSMLKLEWKMCIYVIILMAGFTYYAHAAQDTYTTFMLVEKELGNTNASKASIIMMSGGIIGGATVGYISQYFGRRRLIIIAVALSMCIIPAWILPNAFVGVAISGFFMQFFVNGAFGIVPIHLNELSPPAFRSAFPGVTYQLGSLISAPAAQIVNAVAEKVSITSPSGKQVNAYGPVMGVFTAIIAVILIITAAFGPEKRGRMFELAQAAGVVIPTEGKDVSDLE